MPTVSTALLPSKLEARLLPALQRRTAVARQLKMLAGYEGGSTNTPNTNLNGGVSVDNFAIISSPYGDGIRAFNFGIGASSTKLRADVAGLIGLRTNSAQASDATQITNDGTIEGAGTVEISIINIPKSAAVPNFTIIPDRDHRDEHRITISISARHFRDRRHYYNQQLRHDHRPRLYGRDVQQLFRRYLGCFRHEFV